ncbi:MAG: hypothetical protein LBS21_06925 [Clostridiales bacterium]|jgi:hypothetical protein|nr:hypothetical protein [Clostridiales bacterium]
MDKIKVYAVKMAGKKKYTGLACGCEYRADPETFKGLCYLTPPDRGHMIPGEILKETRTGFEFMSTGYAPGKWVFTEVTADNFQKKFGHLIMDDERLDFINTTEDLQEYFIKICGE